MILSQFKTLTRLHNTPILNSDWGFSRPMRDQDFRNQHEILHIIMPAYGFTLQTFNIFP